jgi:anti-sigma-K factor RskA
MSTDLHTLSGAYALDALSAEEAEQFRKHLDGCPACAQEVRELQQAAASMGASEALQPPAHLRAKVLAAADRNPQLPPHPAVGGNVVHIAPRRWGRMFLAAAAAVVVVVVGAVGISQLAGDGDGGAQSMLAAGVVKVFEAQDAHQATMETSNGGKISVATSPGLGEMAVDTEELPELDSGHVYQIWAIHDGSYDSVGVVERERGASMAMPSSDTEVAITVEPAGGSAQPTTEPIMQVNPSSV